MSRDFDDEVWDDYDRYEQTGEGAEFFEEGYDEPEEEEEEGDETESDEETEVDLLYEWEVEERRKLRDRRLKSCLNAQHDWQQQQARIKILELSCLENEK